MQSVEPREVYCHVAGDIYCRGVEIPAQFSMSKHSHPNAHMVLVLRGAAKSKWRNEEHINCENTLFYLPANEPHENAFSENFRSIDLWMKPEWMPRLISDRVKEPCTALGGQVVELMLRLRSEVEKFDDLTPLVMESLAIEALLAIDHQGGTTHHKAPRWLRRAKDLLHDGHECRASLEDIARELGVHPSHVAKVFRSHCGMNVGEYLRRLRIQRACVLLKKNVMPIGEIAQQLGFADQSHFTRTFRRQVGVTPQRYRSRG